MPGDDLAPDHGRRRATREQDLAWPGPLAVWSKIRARGWLAQRALADRRPTRTRPHVGWPLCAGLPTFPASASPRNGEVRPFSDIRPHEYRHIRGHTYCPGAAISASIWRIPIKAIMPMFSRRRFFD